MMPHSEVTHGQNRRSNAGAKTNQLTNHGNVLKMERNVSVKEVGSFMVPRLIKTRKKMISSLLSSSHQLLLEPMESKALSVIQTHSPVLIQLQMLIRYASVMPTKNSSITTSYLLLRLSGSHKHSKSNQRLNSRELQNILVKLTKLPKKRVILPRNPIPLLKLKTRKPLLILQAPKLVQLHQLKSHTSLERVRLHREDLLSRKLSQREEPRLPDGQ